MGMRSKEDSKMTDKYTFKGALNMLIKQGLKILSEENVSGAVTAIHNYQARFDATVEKFEAVHKRYFAQIFKEHQEAILKGYRTDSWLLENDVRVVFGSENPEASHKGYIPLSAIYGAGLEAMKRAKTEDDQLIIYPQIFLLHMYRVFNSLRSDPEFSDVFTEEVSQKVFDCMVNMEGDLKSGTLGEENIRTNNLVFRKSQAAAIDPAEALKAMMNDPMLDNIFGMVTNTFAQSGMIPKEELEKISVNDIRKQFTNILGTDALKKTFEHMHSTMSSATSPEEAVQLSMKMMTDEKFMKEFAEAAQPSASGESAEEKVEEMVEDDRREG